MKKSRIAAIAIIAILIVFAFASCEKKSGFVVSGKKLVSVNSEYITDGMINIFTQSAALPEESKQMILEELVDNFLVYQEALKSDVMKDTMFLNQLEFQRRLAISNQMIQDKLSKLPPLTEQEFMGYYDMNKSKFDKMIKLSIISLGPDKNAADSIYDMIASKKISFSEAAKKYSLDKKSAEKGGMLEKYYLYKEFSMSGFTGIDEAAFSAEKKGTITKPFLEMQGNYIILQINDIIPSNKTYNDLKSTIVNIMYSERNKTYVDSYIAELRSKAKINYFQDKKKDNE